MALIKDKPENVPTTDALAGIQVDSGEREIRLGQNVLLVLDDPPRLGETRDIVLRMRCIRRAADQLNTEGDITHFCGMKIVTAWELGQPKPPNPADDQGSLYDVDSADAEGDGE